MSRNHLINLCVLPSLLAALFFSSQALPTTDACWFQADTLKATDYVTVPPQRRDDFIRYLREEVPSAELSKSEVESDRTLDIILQNTDSGILAITIENVKPQLEFKLTVQTCDFRNDWRPYWRYVKEKIEAFLREDTGT